MPSSKSRDILFCTCRSRGRRPKRFRSITREHFSLRSQSLGGRSVMTGRWTSWFHSIFNVKPQWPSMWEQFHSITQVLLIDTKSLNLIEWFSSLSRWNLLIFGSEVKGQCNHDLQWESNFDPKTQVLYLTESLQFFKKWLSWLNKCPPIFWWISTSNVKATVTSICKHFPFNKTSSNWQTACILHRMIPLIQKITPIVFKVRSLKAKVTITLIGKIVIAQWFKFNLLQSHQTSYNDCPD